MGSSGRTTYPPTGSAGGDLTGTYPNPTASWRPLVSFLAANATNATATMAVTGLSVTVTSGVKYAVDGVLLVAESTAADGGKIDFDTGTAGVTNLRVVAEWVDSGGTLNFSEATALATDLSSTTFSADSETLRIMISGSFEPSSSGTFLIRFAQNSHSTGTLTLYRGSWLKLTPMG